jgi:hypothetical protein
VDAAEKAGFDRLVAGPQTAEELNRTADKLDAQADPRKVGHADWSYARAKRQADEESRWLTKKTRVQVNPREVRLEVVTKEQDTRLRQLSRRFRMAALVKADHPLLADISLRQFKRLLTPVGQYLWTTDELGLVEGVLHLLNRPGDKAKVAAVATARHRQKTRTDTYLKQLAQAYEAAYAECQARFEGLINRLNRERYRDHEFHDPWNPDVSDKVMIYDNEWLRYRNRGLSSYTTKSQPYESWRLKPEWVLVARRLCEEDKDKLLAAMNAGEFDHVPDVVIGVAWQASRRRGGSPRTALITKVRKFVEARRKAGDGSAS